MSGSLAVSILSIFDNNRLWRGVSKDGKISLKDKPKYLTQKKLLLSEGIIFGEDEAIDLKKKGWLTSDRKDRP